ncbi:MAG: helix-turn-helix domain-containing protein [Christensenellales bacterium]
MRLKETRELNSISQKQLCLDLSIPTTTYNGYEKGRSQPDIDTLCKLADYFNVSLDYLCEHETKHVIDTSNWSDTKKGVAEILNQLSEQNSLVLLGYVTHMLKQQNQ